ncbi:hypothetical protein ACOTJH_29095 [Achromobacter xylosoxidans]
MIARLLSWLGVDAGSGRFLLVALACLGAYAHGYRYADIQAEARHNQYVAQHNQARADDLAKQLRELHAEQQRGDALSLQLLARNAERNQLADKLKRRVSRVSTVYIAKPGAAPVALPDRPFTVGWVRDYNAALGLRMPAAVPAAGGAAGAPAGLHAPGAGNDTDVIDPADLARSAVSQADVLTTHISNAADCRRIEAQLNAILDWDEGKAP